MVLIIKLYITSTNRNISAHIKSLPTKGGLKNESVVLCDSIKFISKERLITYLGKIDTSNL